MIEQNKIDDLLIDKLNLKTFELQQQIDWLRKGMHSLFMLGIATILLVLAYIGFNNILGE